MFIWRAKFVGPLFEFFVSEKCSKSTPLIFFATFVARGNAVQILSNFPAKRLSIYRKKFSTDLLFN